ncbi:MAG: family 10 glycosylhydrolase [Saprospiraceae bacterium]|nr:family 10 glycosylhydrolase [Saprospiraceae bacterium]
MRILHLFTFCLLFFQINAQIDAPKREFRAVWVASVANIDYPRQPSPNSIALQEQFKTLLEQYKQVGLNAIIVQIRPTGDALYPTELAPWSKYLAGRQGLAPAPDYDPLKFMIDEAHKMGFEFHAWMNPYRATMDLDTLSLAPNHAFHAHRDWMVRYGGRFYFNPALPQVRQHINDIVKEVVTKYDVDAIHFDDYFYPYKIKDEVFPDSIDFWRYGARFSNIEDWRRSNVDSLIENISTTINEIKPYVKFGISPFGVWRNKDKDPSGSDTRAGATTYDDLYADVVKWMRLGWIDYLIPQLYWNIGFPPADHATLVGWWGSRSYERDLYIGHAAYKVQNDPQPAWNVPDEIPKQIQLNRRNALTKAALFLVQNLSLKIAWA